jgi:serine/threonine protein phosphatase PrpC
MSSEKATWGVICKSVRGALHIKKGIQNQDAFDSKVYNEGTLLMVAVADGHGDSRCFRSAIGSSIAVRVAIDSLEKVAQYCAEAPNLSLLKRNIESGFAKKLHTMWKEEVEKDFLTAGFSPLNEENPEISFEVSGEKSNAISEECYLAYGTTLLAAIITQNLLMFAQIGDGDIFLLSECGDFYSPVPDDERLFANATTSLCSMEASKDFRFFIERLSETPPILIVLSTDGFSNSFGSEEELQEVVNSFLEYLKTKGGGYLETNLEIFLETLSADRVGDDITVGIIFRKDIVPK